MLKCQKIKKERMDHCLAREHNNEIKLLCLKKDDEDEVFINLESSFLATPFGESFLKKTDLFEEVFFN